MRKINLLLSGLFCLLFVSNLNAQNPVWSLPPKYYDAQNLQVQPLPTSSTFGDYQGQEASHAHNAIADPQGNLLFFIVDDTIYDGQDSGKFIAKLPILSSSEQNIVSWGPSKGMSEISVVPAPGDCNSYYIFTTAAQAWPGFVQRVPRVFKFTYSPSFKGLTSFSLNGSTVTEGTLQNSFLDPDGKDEVVQIATTEPNSNGNFHTLIRTPNILGTYKITPQGINLVTSFNLRFYSPNNQVFSSAIFSRSELEINRISSNLYKIVYSGLLDGNFNEVVLLSNKINLNAPGGGFLNNTSEIIAQYSKTINKGPFIKGVEFSPNGDYLYYNVVDNSNLLSPLQIYDFQTQTNYPIDVPLKGDYKFSHIEYNADGKMYYASANSLATFDDPNNPLNSASPQSVDLTNWDGNAISTGINSNKGFGKFQSSDLENKVRILPDQIDGMNYSNHFFVNEACCRQYNGYDKTAFTANENIDNDWNPNSNPLNGGTGSLVRIRDSIVIPAGNTITISDMDIRFADGAKIIVERGTGSKTGGHLVLDDTKLSADTRCGSTVMWIGVQVLGHPGQNQALGANFQQGYIEVIDSSRIEDAKMAIHAGDGSFGANTGKGGGIIKAVYSTFYNNYKDIAITHYDPGNTPSNTYIKKCNFQTFQYLNDPTLSDIRHISLLQTSKIRIEGNTFENLTPGFYFAGAEEKGVGVSSYLSDFTADSYCLPSPINCNTEIGNTFKNMKIGVLAVENKSKHVTIRKNDFINNNFGAVIWASDNAEVTSNSYKVANFTPNTLNGSGTGLFLLSSTGYTVENNDFESINSATAPFKNYGIIVDESGELDNEIYRNTFQRLKVGVQAQRNNGEILPNGTGNNNSVYEGLQIRCNTFTSPIEEADIAVVKNSSIDREQGYCASPNGSDPNYFQKPIGNEFSRTSGGLDIYLASPPNQASEIEYNYFADQPSNLVSEPFNSQDQSLLSGQMCFNPSTPVYKQPNSCPSELNDGGIIVIGPVLLARIGGNKDQIDNLRDTIDGGDTQGLISTINNESGYIIKNTLLNHSPYLSDQVLLELIENPATANRVVDAVLEANAPLSKEVLEALINDSKNYPDDILQTLINMSSPVDEDVLITLLKKTPSVSDSVIQEVLQNNTPLRDPTLLTLLTKQNPSADYLIRAILEQNTPLSREVNNQFIANNYPNWVYQAVNNSDVIADDPSSKVIPMSRCDRILQQIDNLTHERQLAISKMLSVYFRDTTIASPVDSAINLIEDEKSLARKMQLVDYYGIKGDSSQVAQTVSEIKAKKISNELSTFLDIKVAAQGKDLTAFFKNYPGKKEIIANMANDADDHQARYLAKVLLAGYTNEIPEFEILPIILEGEGKSLTTSANGQQNQNNQDDTQERQAFSVYPNPSTGIFNIRLEGLENQVNIKLYDVSGKMVKSFNRSSSAFTIDCKDLNTGIYFIEVLDNRKSVGKKKLLVK